MAVRLTGQGAPDLAKVLRDAGLRVDESVVPDWRLRSRTSNSSWYKNPGPTHVMVHHTATPITSHNTLALERREAYICAVTHPVKPVSNVYIGPSRTFYPLAGGPSNTNGEGSDWWGGGTPNDSMNSYAIAFEYGNNGVGEPYSGWLDLVIAVAACCHAYNIPAGHVRSHFEWAPTRKIDMAGGRGYNGPFARNVPDAYGRIDMDEFRGAVFTALVAGPPPPPPPDPPDPPIPPSPIDLGDDDVNLRFIRPIRTNSDGTKTQDAAVYTLNGNKASWLRDWNDAATFKLVGQTDTPTGVPVPIEFLNSLILEGPAPTGSGIITTPAHFLAHHP